MYANAGNGVPVGPGRSLSDRVSSLPVEVSAEPSLVIVDGRSLQAECLARGLVRRRMGMDIQAFASVEEWKLKCKDRTSAAAVLFCLGGRKLTEEGAAEQIRKLVTEFAPTPVVLLADNDDLIQIVVALEAGAHGYIPSSVGIDICAEAIKLALAGGVFVPASSILAMRHMIEIGATESGPVTEMFTDRQAEVVEALRRGKPNKIIAYELKLRESTVKVHIRNIMKKIKATNRTEVVYKINDILSGQSQRSAAAGSAATLR
jgi:DNA-binding NarL/FixJ family response regulator